MLAPLLLALQVAASAPGASSIAIRAATSVQRVALVGEATAPMLRPQSLAPLLPVVVTQEAPGRYHVLVSGVAFGLEVGVATTTIGGQVTPLAAAPVERNGQLLVPLQLVSEVFPAYVNNLRWNAATHELVIFTRVGSAKHQARLVVVDAGHGGPDNGMTGPLGAPISIYEKDVTLAVAKRLGLELKSRGLRVLFTRTTDTLITLSDRGRIANQAGGDLFISVHVNAASLDWKDPAAGRGFETYFLSEARTEDARRVEEMENQSVRFETGTAVSNSDPLNYILSDMKQNEHLRESSDLAALVQEHLASMHPGPNRGVKQAGFRVLVTAFMPAVLVEIGFGTNAAEAKYLSDRRHQAEIASAIADAAAEYLRRYERRVGAGEGRDER
ncbi:MAG: hypothetical protein DMD26_00705 [Gemmatimonadetes bacterium]|nr:MAG: hypothetical protein DMD26_00705 [Gemmatimonadota bacterium]